MVHSCHHAVCLRGADALLRELQHVRARGRLSRGEGGDGLDAGQVFGFRADVRLHPDGTHQRRVGGPVFSGSFERTAALCAREFHTPHERDGRHVRRAGDDLLLVGKRQRPSRIERKGAAHHVRDHHHGGDDDRVVRLYDVGARRASSSPAAALESHLFEGCDGMAAVHVAAVHRDPGRHFHRAGPLRAGHERRGDDGAGLPGDRASQTAEPGKSGTS